MKKIISMLTALILCLAMLPMGVVAGEDDFTGYIPISTKEELDTVRNDLAGKYYLTRDIEFTEADFAKGGAFYNDGQGWTPIGAEGDPFIGTFDGNGHAVKGLRIVAVDIEYVGLFGVSNGAIQNLGMVDGDIKGTFADDYGFDDHNKYVGSVAGRNGGTIEGCYNTGNVSAGAYLSYVGGIAGYNDGGTINKCYNTGNVCDLRSYSRSAGGIAGTNRGGIITNCYNIGLVITFGDGDASAGGIVASGGNISNCYNIGNVRALTFMGIAYGIGNGSCNNCYYFDNVEYGGGTAVPCTEQQLRMQETFAGFDFAETWEFRKDGSYLCPVLQGLPLAFDRQENTTEFAGGTGMPYDPYLISTKTHLNNVHNYLDGTFKMIADIEFTKADFAEGGVFYNDGRGWMPIGTEENLFTGNFNGNDYAIKKLQINADDMKYVGLFGYTCGMIQNLGMVNGNIKGGSRDAGSVAGSSAGSIRNCYNTGSVSGNFSSGGIAGSNHKAISNCYNTGSVSGGDYVGGIAGDNGADGTTRNCFNTGSVSGNRYVGGIVGSTYGPVSNCYNIGSVSGDSDVGGITGEIDIYGSVSNCYYLDNIAQGVGSGTGNAVSCTEAQMRAQKTFVGFDFNTIWTMAGNEYYLYPELQTVPMQFTKPVSSIEVTKNPNKMEYIEGTVFDPAGMEVTVYYNDGTSEVITSDWEVDYDFSQTGLRDVTVTYGGKEAKLTVTVVAKSLTSIKVTKNPEKMEYIEGAEFDPAAMEVTLYYDNGTSEVITSGWEVDYDFSQTGLRDVTVTYDGKEAKLTVTVVAKSLTSIKVTKNPEKMEYIEGAEFDPAGMEVTLYYNNGTSEIITSGWEVEYDFSQAGPRDVTIRYGGQSTSLTVTVQLLFDFDGDGEVTVADVTLMLQYLNGWDVEIDLKQADLNGDGKVTIFDAVCLLQILAE